MRKDLSLQLTDKAQFSYEWLPDQVKESLDKVFDKILTKGLRSLPVKRLTGKHNLYVLNASRDVRVLFFKEDDIVRIMDIVYRDKLLGSS